MAWLRALLITLIGKPLARMFTGADVIGREHLPTKGPAIVAANHNSHVDTLMLLTIFKARTIPCVRPAAASDYFLKDPVVGWFSQNIIGIIPVARDKVKEGEDVLAPARQALAEGCIVIVFPEGTRGEDGNELGRLKNGVARLAEAFPEAPVTPVWLQGAGRVLPKGKAIPVPMNCTVMVGPPVHWEGRRTPFMEALQAGLLALRDKAPPQRWR
jgi:1-acyl-sn-glycerol-3-phosphate acyltransferase